MLMSSGFQNAFFVFVGLSKKHVGGRGGGGGKRSRSIIIIMQNIAFPAFFISIRLVFGEQLYLRRDNVLTVLRMMI